MKSRNLYLKTTPVNEALDIYLTKIKENLDLKYETISVTQALNRVTRHAVYARYSSPLFNASAMDGIAVISSTTIGASETSPIDLILEKDFKIIDTGDPIRPPFDAVIMAEDLIDTGDDRKVRIIASASPWQHIRPIGEDIVAGEMILASIHKIRPIDISVLLSSGITEIEVIKRPEVAIFPTGSEIIEPTVVPKEGDIIESNSRMFENMVILQGSIPHRFMAIEDSYDKIKEKVMDASSKYDMVILNAGSSAGTEDYTVDVLRELGEVLIHGVAIKPGKPVILAIVNGKPVIGLPGYPVSAYIGFENFITPVLNLMSGQSSSKKNIVDAVITKRLVSSLKNKEYIRVKVGNVGNKIVASPLARAAGAAMSLVKADGFCVVEQNSEGVEAGEKVKVELYRSLEEIENTLVVIGSHDLILDVIGDIMPNRYPNTYVSSTHVGSMGGLMAMLRKEAHITPIHLLDESSGTYNISYIKRMFKEPMAIIKGVGRIQGLMVKAGNPLQISDLEDLKSNRFVNRQRGAGTRILLDYLLKLKGISSEDISGYDFEASTHMAVAALVSSDSADVGMGIQSAAKAMNLDFIPIGEEEYDFVLAEAYLDLPFVQAFIEILKSTEFKNRLDELGGYSYSQIGEIQVIRND